MTTTRVSREEKLLGGGVSLQIQKKIEMREK